MADGGGAARPEAPPRDLLRFLTCGSVDDGKSTLIGRLLYEAGAVPADVLARVERDSARAGHPQTDWSLLVDGLEAEREQGITIDVAYRFFSTPRRAFIVADTPGHEQYTRNMATGASTAELAVLLVDARKGLLPQTRRHAAIVALLGVRRVLLAVNKMDLTGWDAAAFRAVADAFAPVAASLGLHATALPVSARTGGNLARRAPQTPWHDGPTLLAALEDAPAAGADAAAGPFRLPVQYVNRPDPDFRGFAGTIASGVVRPGDPVVVAASGRTTTVARVLGLDGDAAEARAGEAVTLTLADEVDTGRGDLLAGPRDRPTVARDFTARIVWMADEALTPGRSHLLKLGGAVTPVRVTRVRSRLDVLTLKDTPATSLELNEIGRCELLASEPLAFDPYAQNRRTGGFILVDRRTGATLGAGLIEGGLSRASNVHRADMSVRRVDRERMSGHRGVCVWLTGLSGAGKSSVADALERRLHARGVRTLVLDGDDLRHGLNRDLGFSPADRAENIRRTAETARLLVESGAVAIVSLISPLRADREAARALFAPEDFVEVFVDASVQVCAARDAKGLYAKALRGEIADFTGVSAPYEPPVAPELRLDTAAAPAVEAAAAVDALLSPRLAPRWEEPSETVGEGEGEGTSPPPSRA